MPRVDFVMGGSPFEQTLDVDVSTKDADPSLNFRELFEAEASYVTRTLRRLGVADRDLEDVGHEVFLSVYRNLPTYDRTRPIKPWLFAFAFRMASSYRRRKYRQVELEPDVDATEPQEAADVLLEQQAKRQLLLDALSELDIDRRAVFIMHELDTIGCADIARALAIPLGTVYSRLRLAREDLERIVVRLKRLRGFP